MTREDERWAQRQMAELEHRPPKKWRAPRRRQRMIWPWILMWVIACVMTAPILVIMWHN